MTNLKPSVVYVRPASSSALLAAVPPPPETLEVAIAERRLSFYLEVQEDDRARRVPLGRAPLVVGTSKHANIVVSDRTVSGRHCELTLVGGGISVRDLGSRNGTFVGGARVGEALATQGTVLAVGQVAIVCHAYDDSEVTEVGPPLPSLAGSSRAMLRVADSVRRLAKLSAPVLVTGETGVGKELVARALHDEGPRRSGPFVAMNVASLPRELVESELFGHERGAFTGAVSRRLGAFDEAEGGTLFLDEIGELPLDAQPKLLRALDGYELRRVGASGGRRANVRVVAATHAPLREHVGRGAFRRDLFHRLEVLVVEVPPLRERVGDVIAIARRLLGQLEGDIGQRSLTPAAIARLTAHAWPGNVRELRNVLYRSADLSTDERWIDADAVERAFVREPASSGPALTLTPDLAKEWLMSHSGNVSAAARAAGMARTTFRKLLGEAS